MKPDRVLTSILLMILVLAILMFAGCDDQNNPSSSNRTASSAMTASGSATLPANSGKVMPSPASTSAGVAPLATSIAEFTAATNPFIVSSLDRLIANSDDIFVGTVTEALPTIRIDEVALGLVTSNRTRMANISSFEFRVDAVVMGKFILGEKVRIDLHGGVADGISENFGIDYPKQGTTYLLFVYRPTELQGKAYFQFLLVDSFNSCTEIHNGILKPHPRATVFPSGYRQEQALADVQEIISSIPRRSAIFSKAEVDAAKSVVKAYFVARNNHDTDTMRRVLYGSYDPDSDTTNIVKTTVLSLGYDPSDPARISALIPDLRRNDFSNVIVLRADLSVSAVENSGKSVTSITRNRAIVLVRGDISRDWRIAAIGGPS